MSNTRTMVVSSLAVMFASSAAYSADFQQGTFKACSATNTCAVHFTGPGAGKKLRLQNVVCKLLTSTPANAFVIELFDGNNALYLKAEAEDTVGRSFVAGGPTLFITGGNNINITALVGGITDSLLACTITGQSS